MDSIRILRKNIPDTESIRFLFRLIGAAAMVIQLTTLVVPVMNKEDRQGITLRYSCTRACRQNNLHDPFALAWCTVSP